MENDLGNYIKKVRTAKDLSLRELSGLTGISHSYLHVLETGVDPRSGQPVSVTIATLKKLAAGLDIPLAALITAYQGLNEEITPLREKSSKPELAYDLKGENIRMVPILGNIAAGDPCFAANNVEGWYPVDIMVNNLQNENLDNYYYLRIHGDSMQPMFNDHDLVLIEQGPVENGQIAAVLCEGESACVKKIQYLPDQNLLMLISRNPNYPPVTKPMADCRVLGRVILRMGVPQW